MTQEEQYLYQLRLQSRLSDIGDMNGKELREERARLQETLANPKTMNDFQLLLDIPILLRRIDNAEAWIKRNKMIRKQTKWNVGDIIELAPLLTDKRILRKVEGKCEYVVVKTGRQYKLERIGDSDVMPQWITKGVRFDSDKWIMMCKTYISYQGNLGFGLRKKYL